MKYRIDQGIDHATNQRVCVLMVQGEKGGRYAPLIKDGKPVTYIGPRAIPMAEAHKDMLEHTREADLARGRLDALVAEDEQAQGAGDRG